MEKQNPLARLAESVAKTANGARIVSDWLGSGGKTVPQDQACSRAKTCLNCPCNVKLNWLAIARAGVGRAIMLTEQIRRKAKLSTPYDSRLGECKICLCYLRLKVWVPLYWTLAHTNEEEFKNFPPHCWILKEKSHEHTDQS